MRPIELTRAFHDGTTESFYVNPAHIVSFSPLPPGALVTLITGVTVSVAESPEQIIGRLADHRSRIRAEKRDGIEVYRP